MKNQIKLFMIAIAITTSIQAQTPENSVSSNCSANQWNSCGSVEEKTTELYMGQWLRIPFETTGGADSVVIYAEISDASGSFSSPTIIGVCAQLIPEEAKVKGMIKATIPGNLELSNSYRIRLVNDKGNQIQIILSDITLKSMNVWFADFDGDGLGDPAKSFVSISEIEPGFVKNANDTDDSVFQSAEITGFVK